MSIARNYFVRQVIKAKDTNPSHKPGETKVYYIGRGETYFDNITRAKWCGWTRRRFAENCIEKLLERERERTYTYHWELVSAEVVEI